LLHKEKKAQKKQEGIYREEKKKQVQFRALKRG